MTFSIKKFNALFKMKAHALLRNANILTAPLLAIGFVIVMRFVIPVSEVDPTSEGIHFESFLLNMGLMFNIAMGGVMMSSQPLAEEKEKNTLRVLMTSSVSSLEFFLASLFPPLLLMTLVNLILIPVSGYNFSDLPLVSYLFMTTLCSCISLMLGFVGGLVANSQMQASLVTMPFVFILAFIPMFSIFKESIKKVADFLYIGVLNDFTNVVTVGDTYQWTAKNIIILLTWIIGTTVIFMYAYRKNSLDK